MIEIKFRAVIPERNAKIIFTLEDLIMAHLQKELFSIREILIPWLLAGNTPDRFTGLTDKNGVEIYEGDVVEVDTTGMNYQPEIIKGIVKCIDGCFTVEFTKPVYDNVLKCMRERLYVKCFTVNKAIKVIGNIYVNHELLE